MADPQRATAQLLAVRLGERLAIDSVGVATTGEEVLDWVQAGSQSLVISEIRLQGGGIFPLADAIFRQDPEVSLLAYTNSISKLVLDRLIKLPLAGVLLKTAPLETILSAIEQIARGERLPDDFYRQSDQHEDEVPASALEFDKAARSHERYAIIRELTDRQYSVLLLLADGLSVKQVAHRMDVSVKTVDSLKYRLMKQLDFHDRVDLTRFAIREGLIDP